MRRVEVSEAPASHHLPRKEHKPKIFNDAQIAQFREQGYLAVPDFWTAQEVKAMQSETERLKQDGLLRNVATERDGKTQSSAKANLQICPIYPRGGWKAERIPI